jgi:hypothetical protein
MDMIRGIQRRMAQWKNERLPPPRVSQSEYDKVGLTRAFGLLCCIKLAIIHDHELFLLDLCIL